MVKKQLQEIQWDGRYYLKASDGSHVNPQPKGKIDIDIVMTGITDNVAEIALKSAKEQGLLDMVNAYEKIDQRHGNIRSGYHAIGIKLYHI